jgi:hypothetical protein
MRIQPSKIQNITDVPVFNFVPQRWISLLLNMVTKKIDKRNKYEYAADYSALKHARLPFALAGANLVRRRGWIQR